MPTIEARADILASADEVFAVSQDMKLRHEWDSFGRESRYTDGSTTAHLGARNWVRARNGLTMEVEYIAFTPPVRVAMRMIHGPPFFKRFSGAWVFDALEPHRTRATFRYNFHVRPRWLAPILDRVIARVLQRDMDRRVLSLKTFVERRPVDQRAG